MTENDRPATLEEIREAADSVGYTQAMVFKPMVDKYKGETPPGMDDVAAKAFHRESERAYKAGVRDEELTAWCDGLQAGFKRGFAEIWAPYLESNNET